MKVGIARRATPPSKPRTSVRGRETRTSGKRMRLHLRTDSGGRHGTLRGVGLQPPEGCSRPARPRLAGVRQVEPALPLRRQHRVPGRPGRQRSAQSSDCARQDLGEDTSPWEERAHVTGNGHGATTDSSVEQGLEAGCSRNVTKEAADPATGSQRSWSDVPGGARRMRSGSPRRVRRRRGSLLRQTRASPLRVAGPVSPR